MFTIGDFVYLNSGSPMMVVQDINQDVYGGTICECLWWTTPQTVLREWFNEAELTKEPITEYCMDCCGCDLT